MRLAENSEMLPTRRPDDRACASHQKPAPDRGCDQISTQGSTALPPTERQMESVVRLHQHPGGDYADGNQGDPRQFVAVQREPVGDP
jgi:hypothetical protein